MHEIGLSLIYNGKENIVMSGDVKKYPVGGMASEYARLKPTEIKKIITKYKQNNEEYNKENIVEILVLLKEDFVNNFGLVTGTMITTEIFYTIQYLVNKDKAEIEEILGEYNENNDDKIKDYILENSGLDKFKLDTIYNSLLFFYYCFSQSYVLFKAAFYRTVEDLLKEELINQEDYNIYADFYGSNFHYQDIDYKILLIEGKYESVYTIKNSFSLFLFEMAHIIDNDIPVKKCKNCGNYFIPLKRSDEEYCDYIFEEKTKKTCKDVGARLARAKKEKTDEFTSEYRKLYMRLKMQYRRSPSKTYILEKLDMLVEEAKDIRKRIDNEDISKDEWKNWLLKFEDKEVK